MYLIGQTFIYLALALIIGGAIGYAFRACLADTACDDVRDDLKLAQSRYDALEGAHSQKPSFEVASVAPLSTPAALPEPELEPAFGLANLTARDLEVALLNAAPGTSLRGRFGRDDLTAIMGITPKIATWLELNGITRFSHIANLTASELHWLIENLPQNGASVYRDHWVAQAVGLDAKKTKV